GLLADIVVPAKPSRCIEGGARRRYFFPTSTPPLRARWIPRRKINGHGATIFASFAAILVATQSKAGDDESSLIIPAENAEKIRCARGILLTFVPLLSLLSPRLLPYRRRRVLRPSRGRRVRRCR